MNIEIKKQVLSVCDKVSEETGSQNIDLEINLPDYCTDIKRILRCFVIPSISSVSCAGDRVSANGDVLVRLIYVGQDDKCDCFEQTESLSVYTDVRNMPENAAVCAKAVTQFVNCRAASQRRFVVGAGIAVSFSIYGTAENDVICGTDSDVIETKTDKFKCVTNRVVGEKIFDVSETVPLPEGKKPIGKITSSCAAVKVTSAKAVSSKVLIKGEMEVRVCYISDTKDRTFESFTHTMPISQIIEVPGIEDDYDISSFLEVCFLCTNAKQDASGEGRLLDIAAKASAEIVGIKEGSACVVTDCYCTKYDSKPTYKSHEFLCSVLSLDKKLPVSEEGALSSKNVKSVINAQSLSQSHTVTLSDGSAVLKGSVLVGIFFFDNKDKMQYAEKNVDFETRYDLKENCGKIKSDLSVCVKNLKCSANSGKADISFDTDVFGKIYKVFSKQVLDSITADENSPKASDGAALTAYYCSKGEALWDIAKRYNTSEKCIKEENGLDDETVLDDRMIIIPCVG